MIFRRLRGREDVSLTCQSVARSHIGKVRTVNEDRVLDSPEHRLWAVADGMGGHALGDQAATIVTRALARLAESGGQISRQLICQTLETAHHEIRALGDDRGQTCGTTVAGLHIRAGKALIFWAGDSRIYRLRRGSLDRLTKDHSVTQELTDAGVITERLARTHPQANVITRAIGVGDAAKLDFAEADARRGDIYLLCSDGLSGLVDDQIIASWLSDDLAASSAALQNEALKNGGTDNISLLIVKVL